MKIVCTNVIERLEKKRITSSEDLKIEKLQRKNLLQDSGKTGEQVKIKLRSSLRLLPARRKKEV